MSLLRHLLSSRGKTEKRGNAPDFVDTQPDTTQTTSTWRHTLPAQGQPGAWAESALELAEGAEVMEFPGDSAADLMDEFFAKAEKRAA